MIVLDDTHFNDELSDEERSEINAKIEVFWRQFSLSGGKLPKSTGNFMKGVKMVSRSQAQDVLDFLTDGKTKLCSCSGFCDKCMPKLPKTAQDFCEGVITTRATPTRQGCDGSGPCEPAADMRTTPDHTTDCDTTTTGDDAND